MKNISEQDLAIINELEELRARLEELQSDMERRPHSGCACSGEQMCALHAGVWKKLDTAANHILFAQAMLRTESK